MCHLFKSAAALDQTNRMVINRSRTLEQSDIRVCPDLSNTNHTESIMSRNPKVTFTCLHRTKSATARHAHNIQKYKYLLHYPQIHNKANLTIPDWAKLYFLVGSQKLKWVSERERVSLPNPPPRSWWMVLCLLNRRSDDEPILRKLRERTEVVSKFCS